jgi:hypothetical protein
VLNESCLLCSAFRSPVEFSVFVCAGACADEDRTSQCLEVIALALLMIALGPFIDPAQSPLGVVR